MRIGHVIYLSSSGCSLWTWQGRQFVENGAHTEVGEDPGPVVAELTRLDNEPVGVLVDMTDEEHVRDVVARLGQRDQHALLDRKLARIYPRTSFRAARVQNRNAANQDENHVLLSALTRPEPLRAVLEQLAASRLPVAGIFSPSSLTERLLDARARAAPAAFMILRRSNGRLQHSFFRHGHLAGSRRLRAAGTAVLEDPAMLMRQVDESLRYFDATFAVSPDSPLDVLLTPADFEQFGPGDSRGEGWHLRPFDEAEMRSRLRLGTLPGTGESERIFIELLRDHPGQGNFAPPAELRYYQLFRVRSFARAACLVVTGAALAGTLANGTAILEAGRSAADSSTTVQQLESLLPATVTADGAHIDPLEMQQVVSAYDAIAGHAAEPDYVLVAVGTAVSRRPHIQVDGIDWTSVQPAPEGATADDAQAPVPPEGVTVHLKGRVTPFAGNYPLAFDELQAFMDELRSNPDVEHVVPLAQPLDVSSSSTLTGELAAGTPPGDASFTLEIRMRLPHARA